MNDATNRMTGSVPLQRPYLPQRALRNFADTLESGWWGYGPKTQEFERRFAALVGTRFAVAVSSASAGQDLVLKALGHKQGNVVSPTISFATTASVPLWNGLENRLVDVVAHNLTIDPQDCVDHVDDQTRAVICVHLAGSLADVASIKGSTGAFIVEDCAHLVPSQGYRQIGEVAVWSFQATKIISCGDGGMITLNDEDLFAKLRSLSWFGIPSTLDRVGTSSSSPHSYSWDYEISNLGYKAYMNDLTATLGMAQLDDLDRHLSSRMELAERYDFALPKTVQRPAESLTYQYYVTRVPAARRDQLIAFLGRNGIHAGVHYKPLHLHPIFRAERPFPVADQEWKRIVSLPMFGQLRYAEQDEVIRNINAFFPSEAPKDRSELPLPPEG